MMADKLQHDCSLHPDPQDCADAVVIRYGARDYGLPIHDGGSSYIAIRFCPWCGSRL
jgi:hypothetical protein